MAKSNSNNNVIESGSRPNPHKRNKLDSKDVAKNRVPPRLKSQAKKLLEVQNG